MVQKISIAFINYVICLFVIAIKLPVCYGRKPERTVKVLQEKNTTSFYFNEKVSLRLFINCGYANILYNIILGLYSAHNKAYMKAMKFCKHTLKTNKEFMTQ